MNTGWAQKQKLVAPEWPGVNYSYAKIYLYNLENQLHHEYQIIRKGKLNPTAVGDGIKLNQEQTTKLLTQINGDTRVLNEGLAKCYEPHHGIVFYNEKDSIVAATDICFLCEGIRFYPSKKYYTKLPDVVYSDATMKKTYKQLADFKAWVISTGIPVHEKQLDYGNEAKKLALNDSLVITNDSVFMGLFQNFKNIPHMKKFFSGVSFFVCDSSHTFTGGGDKVTFYEIEFDKGYVEASSYDGGPLWIVESETANRYSNIYKKFKTGMRKIEIYDAFKKDLGAYFYNPILIVQSTEKHQRLTFTFNSESGFVEKINYYTNH